MSLDIPHLLKAKSVTVGKRVGEWVYELFITTLDADGFLVEDILDLYHGRGAFEAVLADEDIEEDPDRWCSYTGCGQELWQITCQWVWNLRLSLGQTMQGGELRSIKWTHPKKLLPLSWLRKTHPKSMARGSGLRRSDEPRGVSGQRPSSCKRMGGCAVQQGQASG